MSLKCHTNPSEHVEQVEDSASEYCPLLHELQPSTLIKLEVPDNIVTVNINKYDTYYIGSFINENYRVNWTGES